ncbi:MAG: inositol monophosphatase family protein [Rhodothermales bacterium]
MEKYERELSAAARAARQAGELIKARAGSIREADVRKKGLNDLVTEVDEAAQAVVIRTLQETFPDALFLAEEGEAYSDDVADEPLWIIDPIDGTTNFTRGVPPYAVSIGLRDGDGMAVGVVLDVPRGELFSAVRGEGFFVNGVPYAVSRTQRVADSLITTGFLYREIDQIDVYLEVLGAFMRRSRGMRRPGSAAVDLAYVAAGRFDGFYETGLQAWDVAAGMLLVEEAGGRVTTFRADGDPLFDEQLLASNGRIHQEMMDMLAPMRDG